MREIKFRAWRKNEMFSGLHLEEILSVAASSGFGQEDNIIWMQFTGLTDKNGVEIYEGDIISHHGTNLEVKWHDEYCKYILNKPHGWLTKFKAELSEVVGNIHENPELLCAKK